jgi:hypothetical protein
MECLLCSHQCDSASRTPGDGELQGEEKCEDANRDSCAADDYPSFLESVTGKEPHWPSLGDQ